MNNFDMETRTGFMLEDHFFYTLDKILMGSERSLYEQNSNNGFVHGPGVDDPRVYVKTLAQRSEATGRAREYFIDKLHDRDALENYHYMKVWYKDDKEPLAKEWNPYILQLMDFLDYIVPFFRSKEKVDIQDIVYADHTFTENGKPEFHILFYADEPMELMYLWALYRNWLERKKL